MIAVRLAKKGHIINRYIYESNEHLHGLIYEFQFKTYLKLDFKSSILLEIL